MDTTQLLKGVLDVAVLAVVAEEDGYGYDVVRRLRAAGLGEVGDASVYGTLRRLYAAGSLTSYVVPSDEGPHRKYYGITPHGRDSLAGQVSTWLTFAGAMQGLLTGARAGATGTLPLPAGDDRPATPEAAAVPRRPSTVRTEPIR